MRSTPAEIRKYLNLLEENLRRLARISSLSAAQLRFSPDKQTWSPVEILAHLRSCADVWGETIFAMLKNKNPKLPELHPRKWQKSTGYESLPFQKSFNSFRSQRKELLQTLQAISLEDWERSAVIGNRRHTVFTQARRLALHEREHCNQIEKITGAV